MIIALLDANHDPVIRAATTALRNLAIDPRNKAIIGTYVCMYIHPIIVTCQAKTNLVHTSNFTRLISHKICLECRTKLSNDKVTLVLISR